MTKPGQAPFEDPVAGQGCIFLKAVFADEERGVFASAGRVASDRAKADSSKDSLGRFMKGKEVDDRCRIVAPVRVYDERFGVT